MKRHQLIQGLRLSIAWIAALSITHFYHYPDASWVMISIIVVVSTSHETKAILKKALFRILGTLAGVITGLIGLHLLPYSYPLVLAFFFLAVFVAGYFMHGEYAYIAIIAGITMSVISGHLDDYTAGLWRALNVLIGAAAGCLISFMIPTKKRESD